MYRAGAANAYNFGVAPDDFFKGSWAVRNRLIHDLATQNKVELLLWDTWQWMEYDVPLTEEDLRVLDGIAALTQGGDSAFVCLRAIYDHDERLKAPTRVMSYNPVGRRKKVTIG